MNDQPRTEIVFDREYEGSTRALRDARTDVVGLLRAHGADENLQDRAALVLSELASNAVQASPGRPYRLRVALDAAGTIAIALTSLGDFDKLPPREQWGPATLLAARGRGLLIVGNLSDRVDVEQPAAGAITVTATLHGTLQL